MSHLFNELQYAHVVHKVLIMDLMLQSWAWKSKTGDGFMKKHFWEVCDECVKSQLKGMCFSSTDKMKDAVTTALKKHPGI
jgi:hypothetical protein